MTVTRGEDRTATTDAQLREISQVKDRYHRPGSHLTVVLTIPVAGSGTTALETSWHSREVELRHAGASKSAIEHAGSMVRSLPATGRTALVTANDHDAAWCWLYRSPGLDGGFVGRMPRLLPVIAEVQHDRMLLGAVVDRAGADLYGMSTARAEPIATIEGDREFIHRGAPGGWSQHRFQERAERTWELNATLVAERLTAEATAADAAAIVLTGDVRACGFVLEHLPTELRLRSEEVAAGARHEPNSAERLAHEADRARAEIVDHEYRERLDRLAEEVGKGRRGVVGFGPTVDHMAGGLVETLFIADQLPPHDWFDFAAQQALDASADVIVLPKGDERLGRDGVAALLRRPQTVT